MVDVGLAGKRALVAGAGRGIGRATALLLAGAGARVGCMEAHLRDIEVRMMGYDETTRKADVARASAARKLAALDVRLERSQG